MLNDHSTGTRAYVANFNSKNVSVISTISNRVIATIPVKDGAEDIVVSPDGRRVYVSNQSGISIIRPDLKRVVGRIPLPGRPEAIAISPDGRRVYATVGATLLMIDTKSRKVVSKLRFTKVDIFRMAISPNGERGYVGNFNFGSVTAFNAKRLRRIARIRVSSEPYYFTFTPNGKRLYVTNFRFNKVTVINVAQNRIAKVISLGIKGRAPIGIAITPTGNRAYVATETDVVVINTLNNQILTLVPLRGKPLPYGHGVAISGTSEIRYPIPEE